MRKKTAAAILVGALSCILFGVGGGHGSEPGGYKKLSASQAKALMDAGEPYVLLDVRTAGEFYERRIKGATLIPYTEMKNRAASDLPDKDALIFIYCRSGRRSAIAGKELGHMGYTRVYDFGGINSWPYEVITGADNTTQ